MAKRKNKKKKKTRAKYKHLNDHKLDKKDKLKEAKKEVKSEEKAKPQEITSAKDEYNPKETTKTKEETKSKKTTKPKEEAKPNKTTKTKKEANLKKTTKPKEEVNPKKTVKSKEEVKPKKTTKSKEEIKPKKATKTKKDDNPKKTSKSKKEDTSEKTPKQKNKSFNKEKVKEKEPIKKGKIFIILFRLVSLIIIVVCSYYLIRWAIENKKNNELINDLKSKVKIPEIQQTDENIISSSPPIMDFSSLLAENSDTVAWIKVNNTNVDFPVVKTSDNNYYLKHNFNKEYNSAGWIFADFRNKFDGTDKNIIIYGHNRRDGSMFSSLKNALEESWYTNSENLEIPLYTLTMTYRYQIFSIYSIKAKEFDSSIEFETEEDYLRYLYDIKSKSIHDFGIDVDIDDDILTLYTCGDNTKYRVVIHAKKITE